MVFSVTEVKVSYRFEIHPRIGVARVGNSPDDFYLAPDTIGGLPIECDIRGDDLNQPVRRFKDPSGRMRRQAARFKIFRRDDTDGHLEELDLDHSDVADIRWTVHLANKKACWYEFLPLIGDDMLDPRNTYEEQFEAKRITLRNGDKHGSERRLLMIDPGPRHIAGRGSRVDFSEASASSYPHASYPKKPKQGHWIKTLGELRTDSRGRLAVLGGYGYAGGDRSISGFAGADTWHDDISDGPVECLLSLKDGSQFELRAWVLVGAPKVAPELVNAVTLDDIMFDVAVRFQNLIPELCFRDSHQIDPYEPGVFQSSFIADYKRDIEPIIRRPLDYIWVANIPSTAIFGAPPFNPEDPSITNKANREAYFKYFRKPGKKGQHNELFLKNAVGTPLTPLMPLNSGSNSVRTNDFIDKFLTLTETQYFLLSQWAAGKFALGSGPEISDVQALDRASVGNCVGAPLCPGIEVTWSLRNPKIYSSPYEIRHAHRSGYYVQNGLRPAHNETTDSGTGCEPGDLTKRMAIPWQADFYNCTAQFVNFTDPKVNKDDDLIPVPPTYYTYWWPPQSPMYVIANQLDVDSQRAAGVMAGYQVYYQRGINSYAEIIEGWSYLAFIVNQNTEPEGRFYGYFVEQERNEDAFVVADVAVGGAGNLINAEDQNFTPVWIMRPAAVRHQVLLRLDAEADIGAPVRSAVRGDHR
jgi:L-lysine 6-oxidase